MTPPATSRLLLLCVCWLTLGTLVGWRYGQREGLNQADEALTALDQLKMQMLTWVTHEQSSCFLGGTINRHPVAKNVQCILGSLQVEADLEDVVLFNAQGEVVVVRLTDKRVVSKADRDEALTDTPARRGGQSL